ncbi:hypothetical protein [Pseudorhodoferax sp. Leaf274]|uniref:hypothetical protein n=1 Tax=Pseudorhodoferax sp. Leaf274 TaxID=1736318 RepID=UPI0007035BEE|nr:hypothetical protein [Pseudorhodoferax sp. Leaf274]KQP37580.1 hypothetical protein ASF44_14655 [Pseudorhodoferax sp. Leaf274]
MSKTFQIELGARVRIDCSGEEGEVRGRAEYVDAESTYFVHYKAADGRATEAWWRETALTTIS